MSKNKTLVILESPNKINKVSKLLGNKFIVEASCGHIRDLKKNTLSIDIDNNFKPSYYIDTEKKSIIKNLKSKYSIYKKVLLACDNDREGEAIAFHISEILQIPKNERKRMIFTEITKKALENSIKQPTDLDMNMFYAQQARRIIDRLIGFKISPVLWKHIQNNTTKGKSLSAGRVQSIVNKLVLDREEEIKQFSENKYYKTIGSFFLKNNKIYAELEQKIITKQDTEDFLELCVNSIFKLYNIKKFTSTRKPPPPFITSSLQQEVSNKFRISPKQTMSIAQKLYVDGLITYMRTDSTILSEEIMDKIGVYVNNTYGPDYYNRHQYPSKKNSQEAHEAIRPCKLELKDLSTLNKYSSYEIRVYNLIWKRTIASQMTHCKIDNTIFKIGLYDDDDTRNTNYNFTTKIENILFDGFTILYNPVVCQDTVDEDDISAKQLNSIKNIKDFIKGCCFRMKQIVSTEKYTKPKYLRFTEASLIKKLDELGIGRPSTYASMVSIIQDRKYATKKDIEGIKKKCCELKLYDDTIEEKEIDVVINGEKQKLVPCEIGSIVNSFLVKHFGVIMNFNFTEQIEMNLDKISNGEIDWVTIVHDVFKSFNPIVLKLNTISTNSKDSSNSHGSNKLEKDTYSRVIGRDPKTKYEICTYIAKYGPVVQLKNTNDPKKSKFAPLGDIKMKDVTMEQALELLKYPYKLGVLNNKDINVCKGQYGVYLKYNAKNFSLYSITEKNLTLDIAKDIINNSKSGKKPSAGSNIIKKINENIIIKNGKFGPYICHTIKDTTENIKIYSKKKIEDLTLEDCLAIIKQKQKYNKK